MLWRIWIDNSGGILAVKQESVLEGLAREPFSFLQDDLIAREVDVRGRQVFNALMEAQLVVVADEVRDFLLDIVRKGGNVPHFELPAHRVVLALALSPNTGHTQNEL